MWKWKFFLDSESGLCGNCLLTKLFNKISVRGEPIKPMSKLKVDIVQESPVKSYNIEAISSKEFIEWLRDVKDCKFTIILNGETIHSKSPRDVANFILGYNVALELSNIRPKRTFGTDYAAHTYTILPATPPIQTAPQGMPF